MVPSLGISHIDSSFARPNFVPYIGQSQRNTPCKGPLNRYVSETIEDRIGTGMAYGLPIGTNFDDRE